MPGDMDEGSVPRIAVIGMGPVGLATAVALAQEGHRVVGVDLVEERVTRVRRGDPPFFESGLKEALNEVLREGDLTATADPLAGIREADFVFLCVGTPSRPDGTMEDAYLRQAAEDVAAALPDDRPAVVVVKSTVLPGTTESVVRPVLEASGKPFHLAVNPEFLREGHALQDALDPDRVVLGVEDPAAAEALRSLYGRVSCPVLETDLRTAESIKYATNAFLATKVAFANELANVCEALGVPYDAVIEGVQLDPRVNPRFLVPGVGFGGSCFPKDVKALETASRAAGYRPPLLEAVSRQNEVQHERALALLEEEIGDLRGKRIALLGLAFKGNTDDVRESRAIPIARDLLGRGAVVVGYDPAAEENFRQEVPEVALAESVEEALTDADGCLLQADWPQFGDLSAEAFVSRMRTPVVVDGRRILDPARMEGVRFRRIGLP